MKDNYLTETKVSKSNNGKGKSFTYSTVIPKVIVTKFGLDKGRKLYWDIDDGKILINPELPEEASINAGNEIFTDMFINGNISRYREPLDTIKTKLSNSDITKEDKINNLVEHYNTIVVNTDGKDEFKKVVLYLLDYPLNLPDQYEILQAVYDKIKD